MVWSRESTFASFVVTLTIYVDSNLGLTALTETFNFFLIFLSASHIRGVHVGEDCASALHFFWHYGLPYLPVQVEIAAEIKNCLDVPPP